MSSCSSGTTLMRCTWMPAAHSIIYYVPCVFMCIEMMEGMDGRLVHVFGVIVTTTIHRIVALCPSCILYSTAAPPTHPHIRTVLPEAAGGVEGVGVGGLPLQNLVPDDDEPRRLGVLRLVVGLSMAEGIVLLACV